MSGFNQFWSLSIDLRKRTPVQNFAEIGQVGAEVVIHADGQTDMTKLKGAFRGYAKSAR